VDEREVVRWLPGADEVASGSDRIVERHEVTLTDEEKQQRRDDEAAGLREFKTDYPYVRFTLVLDLGHRVHVWANTYRAAVEHAVKVEGLPLHADEFQRYADAIGVDVERRVAEDWESMSPRQQAAAIAEMGGRV
jgi:hypothetical protein